MGIEFSNIYRKRAAGLYCINVERNFPGSADTTNLCYWLNSAYFVIGIHDGNEHSLICNRSPNIIWINTAIAINGHIAGLETKTLQVLASVQHSMVFYGRGNQVIALFLRGKRYSFNCKIITFGAAACKGNFGRTTPEDIGYLFAGAINSLHVVAPPRIDTAPIAIFDFKVR